MPAQLAQLRVVNADNAYIVNGADFVTVTDVVTDFTKQRWVLGGGQVAHAQQGACGERVAGGVGWLSSLPSYQGQNLPEQPYPGMHAGSEHKGLYSNLA